MNEKIKDFEDVKCPRCGGEIVEEEWDDKFNSWVGWCINCLERTSQIFYVQLEDKFYEINEENRVKAI